MSSPILRIEVLGRSAIFVGGRVVRPSAERLFAGLLLLGLGRGRRWSRAEFAEMLWPNAPEQVRKPRLRWLLTKMRGLGVPIEPDAVDFGLRRDAVAMDADEPELLSADGRAEILPRYSPAFSRDLAAWLETERDRIKAVLLGYVDARLNSAKQRKDWTAVVTTAEAIQQLGDASEEVAISMAEAQCRLGKRSEALLSLRRYVADRAADGVDVQIRARSLIRRLETSPHAERLREPIFVGRNEHLKRIDVLLNDARRGGGGSLILRGPTGIGKTRLLDEARSLASIAGLRTVRVRCNREDRNRPLSGLADLVPQLLDLRGAAGCDPENLARLRRFASNSAGQSSASTDEHPRLTRDRLVVSLMDLLSAVGTEGPFLVQIDDVQWVDHSLSWLWRDLLDFSVDHPIAWLFAFRSPKRDVPGFAAPIMDVGALEVRHAQELLDEWISGVSQSLSADARDSILSRGAGSPMFIGELVRQWVESGALDTSPTSLEGVVDRGLTWLSAPGLRVLQISAILGTHATVDRIREIVGLPRRLFLDALIELDAAGILTTADAGGAYGHILWADAALGRLPSAVATVLHSHAAENFDRELERKPSPIALWESARHWRAANQPERALRAILAGADHLIENGFPAEAASVLERTASQAHDARDKIAILRKRIDALTMAGNSVQSVAEIDRHEELAAQLDVTYDRHNELELSRIERLGFSHAHTIRCLRSALQCARDASCQPSHRIVAARLAAKYADVAERELLPELNAIALELSETQRNTWDWLRTRAIFERRVGDVAVAHELTESLVAYAKKTGKSFDLTRALHYLGQFSVVVGSFEQAWRAYRESIALAKRHGYLLLLAAGYDHLVGFSFDVNPTAVTAELLREALEMWQSMRDECPVYEHSTGPVYQAMLAIAEGRPHDALVIAPSLDYCRSIPSVRLRARMLAIHLAARSGTNQVRGLHDLAQLIASDLSKPDDWIDWPAARLAEYLCAFESRGAAAKFSNHFVRHARRELYPPPPILAELAAESEEEVATELVAT